MVSSTPENWAAHYVQRLAEPDEPADYIEAAFLDFKPGMADAEDIAASAFLRAGHTPPFDGLAMQGLMRVAQDMIDGELQDMNNQARSEGEQ